MSASRERIQRVFLIDLPVVACVGRCELSVSPSSVSPFLERRQPSAAFPGERAPSCGSLSLSVAV